jgi:phosphoribosyl-ATP pyrophosphohydrolase/phosphoribosyl-AMP cyclohydrolase
MPNVNSPDELDFEKGNGVVTVVAQDAVSGAVLMVAHADREAVLRTLSTREMHYLSRSRGPWHKGAASGNTQRVHALVSDCDGDSLLARVLPAGPACHDGTMSCFGELALSADAFGDLSAIVRRRAMQTTRDSYTRSLLADRNLRLKKLGEEAAELITACADGDAARATQEAADLIYHIAVALESVGSSLSNARQSISDRGARST